MTQQLVCGNVYPFIAHFAAQLMNYLPQNHAIKHKSTSSDSTLIETSAVRTVCLAICCVLSLSACQAMSDDERSLTIAYPSTHHLGKTDSDGGKLQAHQLTSAFVQTGITRKGDSTWLATISDDFAKAKKFVERELAIDLHNISIDVVDDTSMNAEVKHETRQLVEQQFGQSTFSKRFLQKITQPVAGSYAALYSPRLKKVMVSRSMLANYERSLLDQHRDNKHAALMTLLIHELVHAADDLRFDIHGNRELNFRASFAQSATFEGHAQWVTRKICKYAGCSAGLDALDNFMFNNQQRNKPLTQPVEAISRSVLEYSYIEGELFIDALAKRPQGDQLIAEVLQNPPLDPIQILAPDSFPDNARKTRNRSLIAAGLDTKHPWSQSPWIGVETSPLKGVDLRSDPARRKAAIDGFTKLIKGMVSLQYYNQQLTDAEPVEATLLEADSSRTANLFASALHNNTQQAQSQVSDERIHISSNNNQDRLPTDIHIRRTVIDPESSYLSTVAIAGKYVVQVTGDTHDVSSLDDYAIQVLLTLSTPTQ